jgi:putative sterol carrier protein
VIERFATMTPAEVHAFFHEGDILAITQMVRGASDAELLGLVELDHVRDEAVTAILARFEEFADPERLAQVRGVVRFELARPRRKVERHTARFTAGEVLLDEGAGPDVVIRADIVDFVRLVTGQSNAALLYLGGRLALEGDELLALAVGSVFTVPGSGQAAVDPSALDPVEVATAVATTSSAHMREVMRGAFRPIVLEEVFRRFPDFLDAAKARGLTLSIGFRIGGRRDGEVDRYCVHVAQGACTVETSPPEGQRRDATITLEGVDFLRLATGQLHPVRGVLSGALKVRGDKAKALALNSVMVPPQPRSTKAG